MRTREEALNYPRRDLRLAACPDCGFVYNAIFDHTVHEYSAKYEETQGFSPTFNAFARDLARRAVEKYDVRNKTVLEIGCGKGEFLVLLCELGPNRGIGLDPGYDPARTESEAASRIEFIRDFYGPAYRHLTADFVVCRHTLEHIAPVAGFMRDLRDTIDRQRSTLFFELPDVLRVLTEGAFWDIYYEHCTYFTCGSLARLFRATKFDVTDLTLEYDGQYIILGAVPTEAPTEPRLPLENDQAELTRAIDAFPRVVQRVIGHWRQTVENALRAHKRVLVCGSGSKGVSFLTTLGITEGIEHVVDINPHKHGRFMPATGQEIISPERAAMLKPDLVIVMNPIYVPEITRQLASLGVIGAEVVAV